VSAPLQRVNWREAIYCASCHGKGLLEANVRRDSEIPPKWVDSSAELKQKSVPKAAHYRENDVRFKTNGKQPY
jgi:hypothetical protein